MFYKSEVVWQLLATKEKQIPAKATENKQTGNSDVPSYDEAKRLHLRKTAVESQKHTVRSSDSSWVTHVEVDSIGRPWGSAKARGTKRGQPTFLPKLETLISRHAECDPQAAEEIKAIVIEEARYRAMVNAIPRNKRWSFNNIQQ